jgi:hypothetical protein
MEFKISIAYPLRVQTISFARTKPRLHVSFPLALAAAIGLEADEEAQWELLERGNSILSGLMLRPLRPKPGR